MLHDATAVHSILISSPPRVGQMSWCMLLALAISVLQFNNRSNLANGTFTVFFFLTNANGPSMGL